MSKGLRSSSHRYISNCPSIVRRSSLMQRLDQQKRHLSQTNPAKMSGLTPVFTKNACPRKFATAPDQFYPVIAGKTRETNTTSMMKLLDLTVKPSKQPVKSLWQDRSPPTLKEISSKDRLPKKPRHVSRTSRLF